MALAQTIGGNLMDAKRISVSQKRQITIPIDFFNRLGIENEVECYIQNNSIVIRPVKTTSGEFDEEILADLIAQGYSGAELLNKFKEMRKQVRPAVEKLLSEASDAALNPEQHDTYEDIFGED